MKVLVACEFSGVVRNAFARMGHYAVSCDLLETESELLRGSGKAEHYVGDVFDIIDDGWDLMIAHPPCTYLSVSGLHWNKSRPERAQQTEEGLEFVRRLMEARIPKICVENPVSAISSRIRRPDQIIQPYEYGDNASKKTCLWLKNLPKLVPDPEDRISGRIVMYNGREYERWENQTDSGQNRLGPSEERQKLRSVTYQGIANAMANQWG